MSAFVLPAGMPVADHEEMGSHDELVKRLLDIVELQARALTREVAQHALDARNGEVLRHLNDDPAALRKFYDEAIGTYQPPKPKRAGHRPNEKPMRNYALFREHYQKLERDIRRDLQLKPDDELTRETMSANSGDHPRVLKDHMLWHGLERDQWPPSTWPEEPPSGQSFLL